ncbi:ABC transporter substrate-binding protein [Bacillus sp. Marseille-P3661]|uniref:ABC transporter substrate-binding protein n=1 Tax=Bacillus sp. Marseille-P3661 TaxID=1936234 RepID=UPI000C837D59|nr:ABC transporter substrate-binding protein [Bacillus sp. Marseille-P3661]
MKKVTGIIVLLVIFLSACNPQQETGDQINLLNEEWATIEEVAKGTEVNLYMWGGDVGTNSYIDDWVIPHLKEKHDVSLTRFPMDTGDFISKLLTEKKAGKDKGTIDIIWINGENFRNAKNNELLYGDFASKLPNLKEFIGEEQPYVHNDMGTSIDGLEAPWGKVQFVLNYDENKVNNPPKDFAELTQWVHNNPGQFTYPNVSDFTGNAFVRHLLYEVANNESAVITESFNQKWLNENSTAVWEYLNGLEKSLWREGKTYPDSLAQLDQLYANGEVAFTMGFNEKRTESLIQNGVFPSTTKTLVLKPGSIGNTHYLSVPWNSPNKAGALIAINFMLSPEAQIAKLDPSMWGEGTVLNLELLTDEQLNSLETMTGKSVVQNEEILPELDSAYADWIKEHWENEVVQN